MTDSLFVLPLQPFSEMPVWARLGFANMISINYTVDEEGLIPLTMDRVIADGFKRTGDTIWVYYKITWGNQEETYIGPVYKEGHPDFVDPTAFYEEEDGVLYHLCEAPMHSHNIPISFDICYEDGAWTWESLYS